MIKSNIIITEPTLLEMLVNDAAEQKQSDSKSLSDNDLKHVFRYEINDFITISHPRYSPHRRMASLTRIPILIASNRWLLDGISWRAFVIIDHQYFLTEAPSNVIGSKQVFSKMTSFLGFQKDINDYEQ
jgi:hypothetical protein